jgi:hypothetical protein
MSGQQRGGSSNRGGGSFRFKKRKFNNVSFARSTDDAPVKVSKKESKYMLGANIIDLIRVESEILVMAQKDCSGEVFKELDKGITSIYAEKNLPQNVMLDELGPIPEARESIEYDLYKSKVGRMDRRWNEEHKSYKEIKAKFIGTVMKDYMSEDIREYLIHRSDYAENANEPANVSKFFNWLKNSVRDKLGLSGVEELENIKDLLTQVGKLKIRDFEGHAGRYLTRVKQLAESLIELMGGKEIARLPDHLPAVRRAERIIDIATRVRNEVDTDRQILNTVFFEVYKHKLESTEYKTIYEMKMAENRKGQRAPFDSLKVMIEDLEMTINRLESDKVNTKRVRNINNGDNQMRINAMNASKKQKGSNPCGFCTHRLKKEKPNHDFVHCYFNKNSTEYKGDKAKQNALDRAKKIEDEAKQKETQAIINTAVADQVNKMLAEQYKASKGKAKVDKSQQGRQRESDEDTDE